MSALFSRISLYFLSFVSGISKHHQTVDSVLLDYPVEYTPASAIPEEFLEELSGWAVTGLGRWLRRHTKVTSRGWTNQQLQSKGRSRHPTAFANQYPRPMSGV
ncbi:hypothetical protein B0H66DRAFT_560672 [Apodospora peruviana]|uniref:Secreted protein n=1 Tax=Apodospora peruviana TaxID=516989 RepID=A0AAE0I162_9PEZI|nr:hypothetical protein B0H66DRAFT_560672 [Apodospora peruviana]